MRENSDWREAAASLPAVPHTPGARSQPVMARVFIFLPLAVSRI